MIYIKIFMMNGNHGATVCCRYDLKTIFKLSDVAETECVQHVSEREREREKDRQTEGETEKKGIIRSMQQIIPVVLHVLVLPLLFFKRSLLLKQLIEDLKNTTLVFKKTKFNRLNV